MTASPPSAVVPSLTPDGTPGSDNPFAWVFRHQQLPPDPGAPDAERLAVATVEDAIEARAAAGADAMGLCWARAALHHPTAWDAAPLARAAMAASLHETLPPCMPSAAACALAQCIEDAVHAGAQIDVAIQDAVARTPGVWEHLFHEHPQWVPAVGAPDPEDVRDAARSLPLPLRTDLAHIWRTCKGVLVDPDLWRVATSMHHHPARWRYALTPPGHKTTRNAPATMTHAVLLEHDAIWRARDAGRLDHVLRTTPPDAALSLTGLAGIVGRWAACLPIADPRHALRTWEDEPAPRNESAAMTMQCPAASVAHHATPPSVVPEASNPLTAADAHAAGLQPGWGFAAGGHPEPPPPRRRTRPSRTNPAPL